MDRNQYFTIPNLETIAVDSSQTCLTPRRRQKKSTDTVNKRRFSAEQIRSLESIFYSTNSKLDSRKKVQLATELGLQPRQIAIWFQNRRARWKSKEMENNFRSLRTNYDNLASQFKTLQEENNSLLSQLQKLSLLVQGPSGGFATNLNNNFNTNKNCIVNGEGDQGLKMTSHLKEGRSNNISHVEQQACAIFNPGESFESSEKWWGFDSNGGVNFEYQSCSSLQGLGF